MLTLEEIYHAQSIIKDSIIKTPILKERHLEQETEIYLKCENLQVSGSFKIRGATYFMNNLSDSEKENGVIAWSAGNHAQGVALAAKNKNIAATICIPKNGSALKIEETKRYGAKVVLSEGLLDQAKQDALKIQEKEKSTIVPPYDHLDILTGQATIGLEILEDVQDIDAVVVPIGGGGLIGGIAYVIKNLNPDCKVYGVEAEGAASMKYSLDNKKLSSLKEINTIADGIAVESPGKLNYEFVKKYVDEIFTVSDYEISESILHLLEKDHLLTEGAGASAFAAIKFNKIPKHKKIVCVLSGGNINPELLSRVVNRAMQKQKRLLQLNVIVDDRFGSLKELISIISEKKGNIINIHHNRFYEGLKITESLVEITFETNSKENIEEDIINKGYIIK